MKKILSLLLVLTLLAVNVSALAEEPMTLTLYHGAQIEQMQPVIDAFTAKYPNITVNVYRSSSEPLAATMEMELKAANPQFDVVVLGNALLALLQERYNCFEPYTCAYNDAIQPNLLDESGIIIPVGTGFYVIEYNTNLVSEEEAPKSFADLLDPKWTNQVAVAVPTASTSIFTFIWMVTENMKDTAPYGWNYFETLRDNNATFVDSHGTISELVSIGECKTGIQLVANMNTALLRGDPVKMVYPAEGCPAEVNGVVVRGDSPNKKAAQLFVDFLLSVEGQELVGANLGWNPVRSDMTDYTLADGTSVADLNLIPRNVEWVNNNKQDVLDNWAMLFE